MTAREAMRQLEMLHGLEYDDEGSLLRIYDFTTEIWREAEPNDRPEACRRGVRYRSQRERAS